LFGLGKLDNQQEAIRRVQGPSNHMQSVTNKDQPTSGDNPTRDVLFRHIYFKLTRALNIRSASIQKAKVQPRNRARNRIHNSLETKNRIECYLSDRLLPGSDSDSALNILILTCRKRRKRKRSQKKIELRFCRDSDSDSFFVFHFDGRRGFDTDSDCASENFRG